MEDDHDEEVERVREWIDRLGAFASSVDAIEGDSATDFADNALEAWQHLALPSVTGVTLHALVIFGALNALAHNRGHGLGRHTRRPGSLHAGFRSAA